MEPWCMLYADGSPTASWRRRRSRRRWRYWAAKSIGASDPRWRQNIWPASTTFMPDARRCGVGCSKANCGMAAGSASTRSISGGRAAPEGANWCSGTPASNAWLEGRGPKLYLISMIDDASSRIHARFVLHDSTEENMRLVWSYVERYGRPVSYYT